MKDQPELHKFVAFHSDDYIFGHLVLIKNSEPAGTDDLIFTHSLFGEYLD